MTTRHPVEDGDRTSDQEWARRLHDHTHEIELIISGALVFGLLQAPGALDAGYDALDPRVVGAPEEALSYGWLYAKFIVFTLIAAFGLHLVTRAYWVGLVGLDSVFPDGVDWDGSSYTAREKSAYGPLVPPLATLARNADRFASAIFSMAFLIVSFFAFSVLLSALFGGVALAVNRLVPAWPPEAIWLTLLVAVSAPGAIVMILDRVGGERIHPDGTLARWIERIHHAYYRASGGDVVFPVYFVLSTRLPRRSLWPFFAGVFLMLSVTVVGGEAIRSGVFVLAPDSLYPSRPGARSVDARYFAPTRSPASTAPYIQSEIVTGPYVQLELPLVARREAHLLEGRCPDATGLGGRGLVRGSARQPPPDPEAMGEVLDCVGGMWSVSLDGSPLEVAWDFRSAPGLGVTGLVAYLPTAGLDAGPHLLEIAEVPHEHPDEDVEDQEEEEENQEEEDEPRLIRHLLRFRT